MYTKKNIDGLDGGSDHEDMEISRGSVFQSPEGTFRVQGIAGNQVIYQLENPQGKKRAGVADMDRFRQMMQGTSDISPERSPAEKHEFREPEFTEDEVLEWNRQAGVYRQLSDEDRHYIVSMWDQEHSLDTPSERLDYKRQAPERERQRKIRRTIATVATAAALLWIGNLWQERHRLQDQLLVLDYLRDEAKTNPPLNGAIYRAERQAEEFLADQYEPPPDQ